MDVSLLSILQAPRVLYVHKRLYKITCGILDIDSFDKNTYDEEGQTFIENLILEL